MFSFSLRTNNYSKAWLFLFIENKYKWLGIYMLYAQPW
jgi:hypothetical protein